jgi:hypothetical protein
LRSHETFSDTALHRCRTRHHGCLRAGENRRSNPGQTGCGYSRITREANRFTSGETGGFGSNGAGRPEAEFYRTAPDIVPPTDRPNSLSGQKSEAKRARSKVEGTLQERIHYRDLKTRILADGVLQQQWDLAQRARTDAGKREGLKKYYTMFFDRMEKLDPAMKPKIDRRRTLVFHSLEQRRIKSSELIEELESETGEMPLEAGTLRASDTAD